MGNKSYEPKTDTAPTNEPKAVLYWAKARGAQLANFTPERKSDSGLIMQPEVSIVFTEHIFATDDPKKIKYIEDSKAFRAGRIKRCEDEKEAAMFTAMHDKTREGVVQVQHLMDKDVYSRPSE